MSEYVRRVAVGEEVRPKGGGPAKFRVMAWLEDLTDDAIEWSPLKARAARYFGAVQAHAAADEARKRTMRAHTEIRVMRARLHA